MNLRRLALTSCCFLALAVTACDRISYSLFSKEEAPWTRNVLATEIRLPGTGAPVVARLSRLLSRAETVPGVKEAAIVDDLPGVRAAWRKNQYGIGPEGAPDSGVMASLVQGISPRYFATMEISLIQGRIFSPGDNESGVPVAIVSETYAKKNWPGETPIGRRLRLLSGWGNGPWSTVVGVVQDGLNTEDMPEVYFPYRQYALHGRGLQVYSWFLLVRTAEDSKAVAAPLQQAVGQELWSLAAWLKRRESK